MSCEESYRAILRYLTDDREPYAPGTTGNTKRKIRKAAACYVARGGTLLYQRRLKGQDGFTELEVVLEQPRKTQLIQQAHVPQPGASHLNQVHTWEVISQKYWWRGILKDVKDYIRECPDCQYRRGSDDVSGTGRSRRCRRSRIAAKTNDEEDEAEDDELEEDEEEDPELEDEEEEEGVEGLLLSEGTRSKSAKSSGKHELVFVDSKGEVNQVLPKHSHTMLEKLNQQRLSNQFCDITLLIEGEEHRAHKAVLAACSNYFHELFFEKCAATTHEAVVDLSGFTKASFLPLLDFAYTSTLTFNFSIMADIAHLARHMLMSEVLQICESVHKQVEEQRLTVYQRGDVHTVLPPDAQDASKDQSGAYVVTIQGDGHALVTHGPVALVSPQEEAFLQQPVEVLGEGEEPRAEGDDTVTLIAHSQGAEPGDTVTLISCSGGEAEADTMTVVTHSGQAGASESLAVVSACLALEPPHDQHAFLISVQPDKAPPPEGGEASEAEAPPPKRKRGRPAKVKKEVKEVEEEPVLEEEEPPSAEEAGAERQEVSDDPNRRRLRQRSIAEGGYARLHMGLEGEEEERKNSTPPARTSTPKLSPRPGKRGRPPKQPAQPQDGAVVLSESGAGPEPSEEPAPPTELQADDQHMKQEEQEEQEELEEPEDGAGPEQPQEGEHTCSECGKSFNRRYSLIMHSLKHEKARGYKCSLCSKEFQYASSLRTHLVRHKQLGGQRVAGGKQAPPPAAAAAADGPGPAPGLARPPGLLAQPRREFMCDICGKTLPRLYSLRIHMLTHTGVRPHSCKVCGKTFTRKHALTMHRALHDVSKQFQCQYCMKTFGSKRSMEEHASTHTGESKYLCNTCGATFHRASAMSKHLKKHQPKPEVRSFACSHCEKRFFEAKDLQQHMNKHMGLKPFQCQVCGKCYSWKKDWYSHVKSHSVAEPYKCNVCGKEFYEKGLYRRHMKKATHGKKGRAKQNLVRECGHCGRKFTQLREYRRHINNHQGVKPFECLTCGVAWADARSLKRHVRTHTGERPYVCPVCQDAHIDARSLRKHMAKFHGDNLPGKIMLEKDTLQFHNQGTQVEHAVSILASDLPPELRPPQPPAEELETLLITEETVEAMQAVEAVAEGGGVATLSDQGIMQVVNYVLAQQALGGSKADEPELIQTMEVEVAHVAEVE